MRISGIIASSFRVQAPQYVLNVGSQRELFGAAYARMFPWSSATGFGTAFSAANPSAGVGNSGAIISNAIAVTTSSSPYVFAWAFSAAGLGTEFSQPGSLPGNEGRGVKWSVDTLNIVVGHNVSPRISVYPWSGSGFGSRYSNPAYIAGDCYRVRFTDASDFVAMTDGSSPYVIVYPFTNGTGFGTKVSDPATLPTGYGRDVDFTPSGNAIIVGHGTSPYVSAYPWSGSGFGTKYSNPGTLPSGDGRGVNFSSTGADVAVAHTGGANQSVYAWSAGFGSKYSNPATAVAGSSAGGVSFARNADAIGFASGDSSPYHQAYAWTPGTGFGTKYSDPGVIAYNAGQDIQFV